jgi:hypothetical protein
MTVSVVVPWLPGCSHREAAWEWVQARYAENHPDWEIVTGTTHPFSRSRGILAAAAKATGDVLVVADADVYTDPTAAVEAVAESGWAIPHLMLHRLSEESTAQVLAGADWRGLPLSEDNQQDSRPYKGHETGTLVVLRRDVFDDVIPDPRYLAWGQEDGSWSRALRVLVGQPWRGVADLPHLWHPAPPRLNRRVGSEDSMPLYRRYKQARHPQLMRRLIDEAKAVTW